MSNKTVIYQPCYYPKLHYLARINDADEFIIFDDVEFSRGSRQHRAEINFHGKKWLTIPVKRTGNNTLIKDAIIDNSKDWQGTHLGTLEHKYGSQSGVFKEYYEMTKSEQNLHLTDVTIHTLLELLDMFDITTNIHRSSEIPIDYPGDPSEYLAKLTEYVSGSTYLCGQGVYNSYLEENEFRARGIQVEIQDWATEWPDGNVCALDVLFNSDTPEEYIK